MLSFTDQLRSLTRKSETWPKMAPDVFGGFTLKPSTQKQEDLFSSRLICLHSKNELWIWVCFSNWFNVRANPSESVALPQKKRNFNFQIFSPTFHLTLLSFEHSARQKCTHSFRGECIRDGIKSEGIFAVICCIICEWCSECEHYGKRVGTFNENDHHTHRL